MDEGRLAPPFPDVPGSAPTPPSPPAGIVGAKLHAIDDCPGVTGVTLVRPPPPPPPPKAAFGSSVMLLHTLRSLGCCDREFACSIPQ